MIGIKYTCSQDPSGYSEAARMDIAALFTSGINITVQAIKQMSENTDYGIAGAIENKLKDKQIPYKIHVFHLTPDLLPQYQEKNEYTISRLAWETDKLPREWIESLNNIQEIWCMSQQMAEMIKNSGVRTPCYAFPQPIDVTKAYEKIIPYTIEPKDFTFYSIFQWIDRKSPRTLLRSYWQEFSGNHNVNLLIKTYRITYVEKELQIIKEDIEKWKQELDLKHYPRILLCHKLMSEEQMWRLHKAGDIFVNPSSGEGWNRPMQEAMILCKPCVSGNNGGITDVMTSDYYYKVASVKKQATTQPWIPWYTSDMNWKELNEKDLRIQMRHAYEDQALGKIIATKAREYVVDNFSFQTVGQKMKERLAHIDRLIG